MLRACEIRRGSISSSSTQNEVCTCLYLTAFTLPFHSTANTSRWARILGSSGDRTPIDGLRWIRFELLLGSTQPRIHFTFADAMAVRIRSGRITLMVAFLSGSYVSAGEILLERVLPVPRRNYVELREAIGEFRANSPSLYPSIPRYGSDTAFENLRRHLGAALCG